MRFISFNVNGYRAVCKNIEFVDAFFNGDYDIVALQEVKAELSQVDLSDIPKCYHVYWSSADKKGYSGTAVFSKTKPLSIKYGLGIDEHDHEGRVITLEYDSFFFVCVYIPNAKEGLTRLPYRLCFEEDFRIYLASLAKTKHVIVCGDLNVAHNAIDLKNPKENEGYPGYSIEEREAFTKLLNSGYVDTFRMLYPDKVKYTWWSYRMFSRQKGIGWRIDYFLVDKSLKDNIKDVIIHDEIGGSDHCPIELVISI